MNEIEDYSPVISEDEIRTGSEVISTGYKPRKHQIILHNSFKRFNVVVAHRRMGKTVCTINEMIDKALQNVMHNPHYAYIAPTYGQAEKIAWEYVKDYTSKIPGSKPNEGKLRLTINRPEIKDKFGRIVKVKDTITIWLLGAEKPDSIRGIYMDGAILDEFGEMNPVIWSTVVRQCLTDRRGWAIFIGTPKGRNHFWDKYDFAKRHINSWFSAMFKASETNIIDKEELADLKEELTDDEYNQEMECSFTVALTGFFYAKQMNNLIAEKRSGRDSIVPHNPRISVATFWDLGMLDSTAIWFVQEVDGEYKIIDYMEGSGKGIEVWVKKLQELPYNYSRHYWPHDGVQRELISGKERWIAAEELGLRPIEIVPKVKAKGETINAVRAVLPMCRFDFNKCEAGIYCLENYQREWDSKNKVFKKTAKHDWASHGADAFGTFALGVNAKISFKRNGNNKDLPEYAETAYDELSM